MEKFNGDPIELPIKQAVEKPSKEKQPAVLN